MKKYFSLLTSLTLATGIGLSSASFNKKIESNDYSSIGKNSIEPIPHTPSTEFYNDIYIKKSTVTYFINEYLNPGMDLFSTVQEYYDFIMNNFDKTQVANWWKSDFEKTAMVIYNSIGQIIDYIRLHNPTIGITILVFHPDTSHADFILKTISSQ